MLDSTILAPFYLKGKNSVIKIYQTLIHRLTQHILGLLISPLHPHTENEKRLQGALFLSEWQIAEPRFTQVDQRLKKHPERNWIEINSNDTRKVAEVTLLLLE